MQIALALLFTVCTFTFVGYILYALVQNTEVPVQHPEEGSEIFDF